MQLIVNEKNNFLIMNLTKIDKYFMFMMSTPVYVYDSGEIVHM